MPSYLLPFSDVREFPLSEDNSWSFEVATAEREVEIIIDLISGDLAQGLAQARQRFPDLELLDWMARAAIWRDFLIEPSNSRYFVRYFEENYSSDEITEIFDTDSAVGVEELLAAIELKVISFQLGNEEQFALLDYQLIEEESDQILAVYFNGEGECTAVAMES